MTLAGGFMLLCAVKPSCQEPVLVQETARSAAPQDSCGQWQLGTESRVPLPPRAFVCVRR